MFNGKAFQDILKLGVVLAEELKAGVRESQPKEIPKPWPISYYGQVDLRDYETSNWAQVDNVRRGEDQQFLAARELEGCRISFLRNTKDSRADVYIEAPRQNPAA